MRRCIKCHAIYDDSQKYCKEDGTPLVSIIDLAPPPNALRSTTKNFLLGLAAGIFAFILFVTLSMVRTETMRQSPHNF